VPGRRRRTTALCNRSTPPTANYFAVRSEHSTDNPTQRATTVHIQRIPLTSPLVRSVLLAIAGRDTDSRPGTLNAWVYRGTGGDSVYGRITRH